MVLFWKSLVMKSLSVYYERVRYLCDISDRDLNPLLTSTNVLRCYVFLLIQY